MWFDVKYSDLSKLYYSKISDERDVSRALERMAGRKRYLGDDGKLNRLQRNAQRFLYQKTERAGKRTTKPVRKFLFMPK